MGRVLVVDDELAILLAIKARMTRDRPQWTATFEPDPRRALELALRTPFEVVVADARMPKLDGAGLLALLQLERPATARILLASQTDRATVGRTVPAVQQVLTKPCAVPPLYEAIDHGLRFAALRCDDATRARLGGLPRLQFATDLVFDLTLAVARQTRAPTDITVLDARARRGAALVRRWLGGAAGELGYAAALLRDCSGLARPEVSAGLLDIWGVPRAIADAVRWHRDVEHAPPAVRELACAVHVADAMAEGRTFDSNAVVAAGLTARVATWCLAA